MLSADRLWNMLSHFSISAALCTLAAATALLFTHLLKLDASFDPSNMPESWTCVGFQGFCPSALVRRMRCAHAYGFVVTREREV